MEDLEVVKFVFFEILVFVNIGVKYEMVVDVFCIVDGCVVGLSLKVDGYIWNVVDFDCVKCFMD